MEELLEDAGITLSLVASDISGVSGRAMLEALIAGQHDPVALAQLAQRRLRSKIPALTEALTGQFAEHHAFLARLHLDLIERHTQARVPTYIAHSSPCTDFSQCQEKRSSPHVPLIFGTSVSR